MWDNPSLRCLLAIAFLHLLSLIYSQETDVAISGFPEAPENLKCITHDLNRMICSWDATSSANLGLTYKICYTNSEPFSPVCIETEGKRADIPVTIGSTNIQITTLNASGTPLATETFVLPEENVSLIPLTPQILNLSADFSTYTLYLKWNDSGSVFQYELDASWQIQILHKETLETVALMNYDSKLTGKDSILSWNWTSDIPLECTSYYVKIRCYINEPYFTGRKEWSEWSPIRTVPEKDTKPNSAMVFPQDKVVLVGSNVTFCCLYNEGESIKFMNYGSKSYPLLRLNKWSSAIKVQNVSASISSGTNVWCLLEPDGLEGTVLFVGYAPDTPQNLTCETRTFIIITCSWYPGRATALYRQRQTKYILFERISKENVTCKVDELKLKHYCDFPVHANQKIYNFTLGASNPLGQAESSLLIDVTQRVHLKTPDKFTVSTNSSTNAHLSWYIFGNFIQIRLLCQIEINNSNSEQQVRNVSMAGVENSNYRAWVDALHPYATYTFRVRCSASEHFWQWSEWSEGKKLTTLEAPPARGPDIWRERSPVGETLTVFWKPLLLSEANGIILSHEVSCYSREIMLKAHEVPVPLNSTEIKLGGNDCLISVVAKNRAGSSPPSRITSMDLPSDNVKTELAIATGNGIYISWPSDPNVTCGYTLKCCISSGSEPCNVDWEMFPSNATDAVIKSALFQPGVRYNFSLYGCKHSGYQLLQNITGYMKELPPKVAPNFTVEETSSDSILVKWEDIPVEDCQGFLKGYILYFAKGENGSSKTSFTDEENKTEKNITDLTKKSLRILDLQGKTSYRLGLRAYTVGGIGPSKDLYAVTKENSVGLIIAILIPVAVAVVLGVVTSILCYQKREWIKETFYPDIPNPENSKALQFQKNICEGNTALKTLEMNPCTPNCVEVVETQSTVLKIEDTEIISPVADSKLPEDGSDPETGSHVVVSYCPPIIEEEISSPPIDEPVGSSQVIYIDIQSMYQPQVNPEEEPEINFVTTAGYKPQMQLPINAMKMESHSPTEEDLDKTAGYRPQANTNVWKLDSPDSPISIQSNNENGSFGSPCSINSRQFLIPPKDYEDSPTHNNTGWSFTNFFQNKPND
ncbi:leukemia inhibitory factor receptor isoform X1 [Trachemys scripta elegans]|uniref:leukemia inhibitory factor receptor isoform X1 n=1 Tax=Trachemys scripta elegans TaxID=31138 RepID=UPI001555BE38|nr:leukemia inhibitory factor receptor isoform X1 [Trachemys scripta elegans]XP_034630425.1 leukemia inhibitory factor receptor isoform X1 [Trachemys scripta elegans]